MSERVDFLDHTKAAIAHVDAVPKADVQPGAGDDQLHAALPQGSRTEVIRLINAARDDPEYAALVTAISNDPATLDQVRVRWLALAAAHEASDLMTPYAEGDGDSGWFIAAAKARAYQATVLLAVLLDHDPGGAAFLAAESSPEAGRAANDRLLGRISDREAATLTGPAAVLHRYLSARRTDSPDVDASAQALLDALEVIGRRRSADAHEWALEAYELILGTIERPRAYRRAELKAPAVLAYVRKAIHVGDARDGESRRRRGSDQVREVVSLDMPGSGGQAERLAPEERLAAADNVAAEVEARLELEDLITAAGLTKRELDVLPLLIEGLTQVEIGQHLGLASGTAGVHVKHLKDKLRRARPTT